MSDVQITLDGKTVTLRPTLKAAKLVGAAGGFTNVVDRLRSLDIEFYIRVVAAGLDKRPDQVEQAVFKAGLPALGNKVVEFVNLLANGGKPYRPQKLKTVEIEGKTYAEVEDGQPIYVDEEPAGVETVGEG